MPSDDRTGEYKHRGEHARRGANENENDGPASDGNGANAGASEWNDPLWDIVERTKSDPGAFFRSEDHEENLAAAWRLRQDDPASFITWRKKLGDAGCPLRKLDKALNLYDQEMRSDYSGRTAVLPEHLTTDDFIAFMPDHRYIHLPTGILWPAASVDARLPPINVGLAKPIASSRWLAQNRHCEQMTWAPGYPPIITDMAILEGGFCPQPDNSIYNLYKPPVIEAGYSGTVGDAWLWLELVHLLYPEDAEEIIDYFAALVQTPQEKINHILVLGGAPGIGKDSLLVPVIHAVGEWNYAGVSPSQLLGRFNGFLKCRLLVLGGARDLGDVNSFAFYEHIKPIAAAPPHTLLIDMKNMQEFKILNVVCVVITTNYRDNGLYLPPDDRRHFVAWSDHPGAGEEGALSSAYFDKFYDWLENQGGKQHVAAFLRQRDLSKFNPKAPPRKTPAFYRVVNANRGEQESALADAIDVLVEAEAAQRRELVVFTKDQLIDAASWELQSWLRNPKYRRILPSKLERLGFVMVANPDAKDGLWKITHITIHPRGTGRAERVERTRRQAIYGHRSKSTPELLNAARNLQGTPVVCDLSPVSGR